MLITPQMNIFQAPNILFLELGSEHLTCLRHKVRCELHALLVSNPLSPAVQAPFYIIQFKLLDIEVPKQNSYLSPETKT